MTATTMTEEEARQFAEGSLLDMVRGDLGDFELKVKFEAGQYRIEVNSEPATTGATFAEAWLSPEHKPFTVIEGGQVDG